MNYLSKNRLLFELIGIVISILLTLITVFPFYSNSILFPMISTNMIMVFVSTMFIRWIFLFKYSIFYNSLISHAVLFVICIFIMVSFYGQYGNFKFYYEEVSLDQLITHLSFKESVWLRNYLKNEFTFFAILGIISSFLFLVKLIRSVWRIKNS